mgnify:CR=1 FL=1
MVRRLKTAYLLLPAALLAVPVLAQGGGLVMLDQLEKGGWELRTRGGGGAPRRLCVRDGRELIQLEHAGVACSSHVVEDTATAVTVQYTCKGAGYGRTTVRRESNRLVQVDSQGIANGLPFAYAAEGRRSGDCRD